MTMNPAKILLLDLNPTASSSVALRAILESYSGPDGITLRREVVTDNSAALHSGELPEIISSFQPDAIFLTTSEGMSEQARTLFRFMRRECPAAPVIVVTEAGEADEMFEWLKLGAADFITAPLKASDLLPRVWQLLEQTPQTGRQTQALKENLGTKLLVGESPAFLNAISKIPVLAKCNASVLISGETGTGKELCARGIHYISPWANKPFIPVNCGAIPAELVENELFGHERGAFTGAKSDRKSTRLNSSHVSISYAVFCL